MYKEVTLVCFVLVCVFAAARSDEFSFGVEGDPEMTHIQIFNEFRASAIVHLRYPQGKGAHTAGAPIFRVE
jgi:hypothetical protein